MKSSKLNSTSGMQERYQQLVDQSEYMAICFLSPTGIIETWNKAAEKFTQYKEREVIGKHLSILYTQEEQHSKTAHMQLEAAKRTGHFAGSGWQVRKDGSNFWTEAIISAFTDEKGRLSGFVTVVWDAGEKRKQSEMIERHKQVNVQLQKATRLKGEFLANMSHEIRTPMNAIVGISDVLARTSLTDEQSHLLNVLREASTSLLRIINDILDLSKIESGKLSLDMMGFDLVETIEDTVEMLRMQADDKRIYLTSFVSPEINQILIGDAFRLRQILVNLIGNAIKFTESGGVTVHATPERQRAGHVTIRFSVTDTGTGIAEEQRRELFQSMVQPDGSTTRKQGGANLGLSICQGLVELMEGRIDVESEEGQGSTFWFSLPFQCVSAAVKRTHAEIPPVHKRALVVDNNPAIQDILKLYLNSWHIDCDFTSSAHEALSMLRREADAGRPYSTAMIDLALPEKTGLELGMGIKREPKLAKTYLILMHTPDQAVSRADILSQGFAALLSKPIRQSALFGCLCTATDHNLHIEPMPAQKIAPAAINKDFHSKGNRADNLVLLVEDNQVNQMVMVTELQELGLNPHVVGDGNAAVQAVASLEYSLVLMDCKMPGVDGYEATRAIRKMEAGTGRHVPIIAMTANAMQGDKEACLAAGMDDYISKPVRLEDLIAALTRWIPEPDEKNGALIQPDQQNTDDRSPGKRDDMEDKSGPIDMAFLRQRFNQTQLAEILDAFTSSATTDLMDIQAAIAAQDSDRIAAEAHSLKGSSWMIGAKQIGQACADLEVAAKEHNWQSAGRICEQLANAVAELDAFLKEAALVR